MRIRFRRRVRAAITNTSLQVALDRNAERRMIAWRETFASLPDVEDLRVRAREVRQHTLENLDHYLERFTQRLVENGVRVHRAADADEACSLAVSIAQARGATLVAKSKSMTTDEIDLNHALQQVGIRVVETDLGEFIVQLRGEPSAHIITPAVHLLREDVAATFERELGMPYSTDVEDMNAAAHKVLREIFLEAQVGVSGVNFGVVETGTLCLVTNEGNGRMVTTLPSIHIAIMGVERLVPTLDDLALMLQLLPRSATGQKITSYVTLIQGPRREGEPDGPDERHVILLDNGRRVMANSPIAESLLCIRCGACLNVCPVFREIGGHAYGSVYPGPIGSVVSPGLFGLSDFGHLAKASTLCGACQEVCPIGIDLPTMLLRVRDAYTKNTPQPPAMRLAMSLYAWLMISPWRYRLAQRLGAWGSRLLPRQAGWLPTLPPPLSAWTASRHFPTFAFQPFLARRKKLNYGAKPMLTPKRRKRETEQLTEKPQPEDVVERFGQELEDIGGTFIRCEEGEAPDKVATYLRELGVNTLIAWGEQQPALNAVIHRLKDEGFEILDPDLPRGSGPGRDQRLADLGRVDAGLTGAIAGVAETGTLVVPAGRNRSQLASLLPPVHLVLLPMGVIYQTMADWMAEGGEEAIAGTSSLNLISGPSRTADIEMTLTIGVHGPGQVIVFCLD